MRRIFVLFIFLSLPCQVILAPPLVRADSFLNVYAAASLTGPLKEMIAVFEQETAARVKTNFASSGNLARQIEHGAPADVYISASKEWMDYAQDNGTIDPQTRVNPIGNSIVLIAPLGPDPVKVRFDKAFPFADSFSGKFALGDPAHVPAGQYAKQAMGALGWWSDIEPRLIRAKDVRQALFIVESGEVELGAVFASDAAKSTRVQVVGTFPKELHSPIIYSAALCARRAGSEFAPQFLGFLQGEKARKIFLNYGFVPVK